MEALLKLLQDGNARTVEMLAMELNTTQGDIKRQLEFLEQAGLIKRISFSMGCSCGGSCTPDGGFQNMGEMWEVVS